MVVAAVSSRDDVLAVQQAIDAALPATDGVACFNKLYRTQVREGWTDLRPSEIPEFVDAFYESCVDTGR